MDDLSLKHKAMDVPQRFTRRSCLEVAASFPHKLR